MGRELFRALREVIKLPLLDEFWHTLSTAPNVLSPATPEYVLYYYFIDFNRLSFILL